MRIAITGGSGLLGQHVARELIAHGHHVLTLDRRAPENGHKPSLTGDLREPGFLMEALADCDAAIHLAAHIAPGLASDCATFNDNVTMTYNVLRAAKTHKIRRVVVASSIGAYGYLYGDVGQVPKYLPIDERHVCIPNDPYGLSKVVGETVATSFARDNLSVVSLRLPGINYDPTFKRIEGFMEDPGYRQRGFWSYLDARDAAVAFRMSLELDLAGHRIFNVAAPTSNMRWRTVELIQRFFPSLSDIRCRADTNWSGIDSSEFEKFAGFRAKFVWETALK